MEGKKDITNKDVVITISDCIAFAIPSVVLKDSSGNVVWSKDFLQYIQ